MACFSVAIYVVGSPTPVMSQQISADSGTVQRDDLARRLIAKVEAKAEYTNYSLVAREYRVHGISNQEFLRVIEV